jgi:hypothetical protein
MIVNITVDIEKVNHDYFITLDNTMCDESFCDWGDSLHPFQNPYIGCLSPRTIVAVNSASVDVILGDVNYHTLFENDFGSSTYISWSNVGREEGYTKGGYDRLGLDAKMTHIPIDQSIVILLSDCSCGLNFDYHPAWTPFYFEKRDSLTKALILRGPEMTDFWGHTESGVAYISNLTNDGANIYFIVSGNVPPSGDFVVSIIKLGANLSTWTSIIDINYSLNAICYCHSSLYVTADNDLGMSGIEVRSPLDGSIIRSNYWYPSALAS